MCLFRFHIENFITKKEKMAHTHTPINTPKFITTEYSLGWINTIFLKYVHKFCSINKQNYFHELGRDRVHEERTPKGLFACMLSHCVPITATKKWLIYSCAMFCWMVIAFHGKHAVQDRLNCQAELVPDCWFHRGASYRIKQWLWKTWCQSIIYL